MNLNLRSPINNLGYGLVGLNVLTTLHKMGHKVSLWPIGNIDAHPDHHPVIQECISNQSNFDYDAPSLTIYHQFHLAERIGRGLHCALTFFELDEFNEREKHHMRGLDKLFVASHWAKEVCDKRLSENYPGANWIPSINVIPLGVDRSIFNETKCTINTKSTIFICYGKQEIRKLSDLLHEIFAKAFNKKNNVELWMCWENPFWKKGDREEWENLYKSSPLGDKIKFLPRVQTQQQVAELMSMTDCNISCSRAEAWNLECLEMMSLGKHVIVTDYSGHTEYCNSDNSLLVKIDELEPGYDGVWFHGNGNWASIGETQIDQIVEHMREVHRRKQEGSLGINDAGIETATRFSWKNTVDKLLEGING